MNHVYRLVFNRALGVMQVASELTSNDQGTPASRSLPGASRPHGLALAVLASLGLAAGPVVAADYTMSATVQTWMFETLPGSVEMLTGARYFIDNGGYLYSGDAAHFLQINNGALVRVLSGGTVSLNGQLRIQSGGLYQQDAGNSYLTGGMTNAGTVNVLGGNFRLGDLNAGRTTSTNSGSFNITGGSVSLQSALHNTGTLANAGWLTLLDDLTNAGTLTNTGTINAYSSDRTAGSSTLRADVGGGTVGLYGQTAYTHGYALSGNTRVTIGGTSVSINRANSYTGGTAITGHARLGHMGALGTGAVTLTGSGRLVSTISGTLAAGALSVHRGTIAAATGRSLQATLSAFTGNNTGQRTLGIGIAGADAGTVSLTGNASQGALTGYDVNVNAGQFNWGTGLGNLAAGRLANLATGTTTHLSEDTVIGSLSGNGTLHTNGHDLTLGADGLAPATYSGYLQNSSTSALIKIGDNTQTLDANGLFGTILVSAGRLELFGPVGSTQMTVRNDATLAANSFYSGATLRLEDTATLEMAGRSGIAVLEDDGAGTSRIVVGTGNAFFINSAADSSYSGAIEGAGTLQKLGTGTLTLLGNNHQASSLIYGGTVQFGNGATSAHVTGDITNNARLVFNNDVASSYGGILSGTGTLEKQGTGTLTLSGASTYAGLTQVQTGTLRISNSAALGSAAAGTIIADGATLELQGGITTADALTLSGTGVANGGALRNVSGANTVTRVLMLAGDTRINSDAGQLNLNGSILGSGRALLFGGAGNIAIGGSINTGAGSLTKDGAGILSLQGTGVFTGPVVVNAGELQLLNGHALADTVHLTLNAGATTQVFHAETIGNLSGAGDLHLSTNMSPTSGLVVGDDTALSTFSGTISGGGAFTKQGDGILRLAGVNTYSGATTVDAGTLDIAGAIASQQIAVNSGGTLQVDGSALSDTAAIDLDGGTLALSGNETIGSLEGTAGATVALGVHTLTSGGNHSSTTFAGALEGTGGLTKTGSGRLTLSGASTYAGQTRVDAGVLAISNGNALGSTDGGTTVASGAALELQGGITVDEDITLAGNGIANGGALRNVSGVNTVTAVITLDDDARIAADAGQLVLSGGITGAGNDLALGGAGTLIIDGDITTGTGSLTKDGTGTVHLTATNDYTGTTTVNGGWLQLSNGNALADAGHLVVNADGSVQIFTSETVGNLSGAGTVYIDPFALGGIALTAGDATAASTFSGAIRGGGDFVKEGSGRLLLSGVSDYSGSTSVHAGTLAVTGSIASSEVNVAGTGVLEVDGTALSDSAAVSLADTGALVLTGSETIGSLAGAATTAVDLGSHTLTTGGNGTDTVYAGTLTGNGNLVKDGTGTFELSGDSSYTGTTSVSAGTLLLGGSIASYAVTATGNGVLQVDGDSLADTAAVALTGNGRLALTGNETIGSLAGSADSSVDLGAYTLTTGGNDASTAYAGTISGSGGLTKAGDGVLTLSGDHRYTGATRVDAGTLRIDGSLASATEVAAGAFLAGTGRIDAAVSLADNAHLVGTQGQVFTLQSLALGAQSEVDVSLDAPWNTALFDVTGDLTLDGQLNIAAGSGFGTGVYRLFDYGGTLTDNGLAFGTTPAGETLLMQTALAGQVNVVNTGGMDLYFWDGGDRNLYNNDRIDGGNGTWTADGAEWTSFNGEVNAHLYPDPGMAIFQSTAGMVTLDDRLGDVVAKGVQFATDGYLLAGDDLVLVTHDGDAPTIVTGDGSASDADLVARIASRVTGSDGVVKHGAGTLVLTADNTYSGGTTITAGTLQLGNGGTTGAILGDIANNGVLAVERSNRIELAGNLSGSGRLVQRGSGTTVLTGDHAHTGGTTIAAGTLQVGDGGSSGTLSGDIANDGALVADRSDALELAGTIRGSGTLEQRGSGTTLLLGDNSYSGGTAITAGTLQLGDGGSTGSLAGDVANAGTLVFDRGDALQLDGVISGRGRVEQRGAGVTTLTGDNTYAGGTTIRSGTLQLGDGGTSGSIAGNVANDGRLVFDRSNTLTYGGMILGRGSVEQRGSGTTILLGDHRYTGGTTIGSGTLQLGDGGTSGSLVGDVHNAGTLAIDRNDRVVLSGAISGRGNLVQQGDGTTVLGGENRYSGGTTIRSGTLQLGDGGNSGSLVGDIANDATLAFNRSDAVEIASRISGSGRVVQDGEGSTRLTGANRYSGGTRVLRGELVGGVGSFGSGAIHTLASLVIDEDRDTAFANLVSGSGSVTKTGAGVLTFDGAHTYTGQTTIAAGGLRVDGALASDVDVAGGALLSGSGRIAGTVVVADHGHLQGRSGATLAMGHLVLGGQAQVDVRLGVPSELALFDVAGDLTLDGQLNVDGGSTFGTGVYRLFNYGGQLTDHGLVLGDVPADSSLRVQTSVSQQVNLVSTGGLALHFWDGDALALHGNGQVDGGSGTWSAAGEAWTTYDGQLNGPMQPQPGFAIFQGPAGTVSIDTGAGSVAAAGLQFASSGYVIDGGTLTLVADAGAAPTIVTGDGSPDDARLVARIDAVIAGEAGLAKQGDGTLVLTADNTYAGTTRVQSGTLVGGAASFGSGAIHNHAALVIDQDSDATFDNLVSGSGRLTKTGTGVLTFDGAHSYTGPTTIAAGGLRIDGALAGDVEVGSGARLSGGGAIAGDVVVADGGHLQGASGGTLSMASLVLGGQAELDVRLGAPSETALFDIAGDLTLDGRLNVGDAGDFGVGVYRLFDYGGSLTDRGLALGDVPFGTTLRVQTAVAQQVNLVNSSGVELQFWDGTSAGNANNGRIDGGSGTWQRGGDSWTSLDGRINGPAPEPAFAVLQGPAGTLRVDNGAGAVEAAGLQFASDGFVIDGDTLTLVGDGGAAPAIVTGDGSATDAALVARIDAVLAGSDGLVKRGDGTLVLTADNVYTGGTTLQAGTLVGGAASFGSGAIHALGTLVIDQAGDASFANTLSGTGSLLATGGGRLTVTGDSRAFTGTTRVQAGVLTLADSARLGGTVVVEAPARLTGTGRIGGLDLAGTLAIGHSIGTLHVDGGALFRKGSSWEVEVDNTGAHDRLQVSGTASIEGGNLLSLAAGEQWKPRTDYVLLQADGGLSGRFDGVSSNFAFLDARLGYSAHAVTLSLLRNDIDFAAVARSDNQASTANAAQSLDPAHAITDALLVLDAQGARDAFDALSGELHAGVRTRLLQDRSFEAGIAQRLQGGVPGLQDGAGSVWVSVDADQSRRDGDGNGAALEGRRHGGMVGVDRLLGERVLVGAALGTGRHDLRIDARGARADMDTRSVGLFAQGRWDAFSLGGSLARHDHDLDTRRDVAVPGLADARLRADGSARATVVAVEAAWQAGAHWQPYARLSQARLDSDGLGETGGTGALDVAAGRDSLRLATLGLRAGWTVGERLHLGGSLAWQRASGDLDGRSVHRFLDGGDAFAIAATALARDTLQADLGAQLQLGERSALSLGLQAQQGDGQRQHGAQLNWRLAF